MGTFGINAMGEAFIKEFEEDYVKKFPIKNGEELSVERVELVNEGQSGVTIQLVLRAIDGKEYYLLEETVYSPEYDGGGEILERIIGALGLEPEEAKARLEMAGILSSD